MTQTDLKITIHQPFTIEPIAGKDALLTQDKGCDLLELLGVTHWLSSGNLLGLYRDGKLIDHDTDIDVNIWLEWNTDEANHLTKDLIYLFSLHDFTLVYSTLCANHAMQLAFRDEETGVLFDIYPFYTGIEPDVAINYNQEGIIKKPLRFISQPQVFTHTGTEYFIPNHIEEYFVWRFGPNWQTPTAHKVPWQEEATHLQKWS